MAFIGPGSEWFWTALSGIILAVTFIAIYRQLRQQAHVSAIEQLDWFERESSSEQMNRYMVDVLVAVRDGTDPAALPEAAAGSIGGVWEKFAMLARAGHRDTKQLWQWAPEAAQGWWAMLAPWVRRGRAESGDKRHLENFEWLAGVMAEMDRRAGMPPITSGYVASHIGRWITSHQEQIRVAQALRTVFIASPDAVAVAQSAAPVPSTSAPLAAHADPEAVPL
jgi:hypothetical protein